MGRETPSIFFFCKDDKPAVYAAHGRFLPGNTLPSEVNYTVTPMSQTAADETA